VKCGDTFLLAEDAFAEGTSHLHILITDPGQDGLCVLVSVTTRRAKSDTMVCLDKGDHEFIKHPSVITYAYSKIFEVTKLEQMVSRGEAIPKERASQRLISRAQQGMLETDRAPRDVQVFFKSAYTSS
jgi:hypothetical protein